jgi:methyl-accepting chemotaxis protein
MDLQHVIEKHSEWLVKFRSAMKKHEKLDTATILRDDACEIGKWFKGSGRSEHGQHASFKDCAAKHSAFHVQAGKVAEVINAGDYTKAEQLLANGGGYARASQELGVAIQKLKKDAGL